MAKTTGYADLNLYDSIVDKNLSNVEVQTGVYGYTDSNMVKIDSLLKQDNDRLNDTITDEQINALFS